MSAGIGFGAVTDGEEPHAPPQHDFAKVVGAARVLPHSRIGDGALGCLVTDLKRYFWISARASQTKPMAKKMIPTTSLPFPNLALPPPSAGSLELGELSTLTGMVIVHTQINWNVQNPAKFNAWIASRQTSYRHPS